MKSIALLLTTLFFSLNSFAADTDSTGLEGDNLDLYAVLDLFEKSKSLEDFEQKLNEEDNEVNNLDLNKDGTVDYIQVIDYKDSTSHAVTLRVPVSETESQDIAVIEIEEVGEDEVNLQIVGDEALYGDDYFIEPFDEKDGEAASNVHKWKPIRHIFGPRYVVWVSPWRFGVYPTWYRPWKRVRWGVYHPRHRHHRVHYRRVHYRRGHHAHHHYVKHKKHSKTFHNTHHNHTVVKKKTVVKKQSGGKVVGKQTKVSKSTQQKKKTKTVNKKAVKKSTKSNDRKRPGGTVKRSTSGKKKRR